MHQLANDHNHETLSRSDLDASSHISYCRMEISEMFSELNSKVRDKLTHSDHEEHIIFTLGPQHC